jgi:transcription elongation factor Elf1
MRNIECPNCHDSVVEIDETRNIDNTISIQRCKLCGYSITLDF